jgi:hypothetical protein
VKGLWWRLAICGGGGREVVRGDGMRCRGRGLVGVRICLHSLTIVSSSDSCVTYSCLMDSIGFSHVFYPMRSSVDTQEYKQEN